MTTDFSTTPMPLLTEQDALTLSRQAPRVSDPAYYNWLHDICNNGRNFDPPWGTGSARDYVKGTTNDN